MNTRHLFGVILTFPAAKWGGLRRGFIHEVPSHMNSHPGPNHPWGGDDLLRRRFHTGCGRTNQSRSGKWRRWEKVLKTEARERERGRR
jgi:hypothetical protein